VLLQIHFYNSIAAYVRIKFDYLEAPRESRNSIYNLLKEKYDFDIDADSDNLYIDVNKNFLKVFDNGQINLQYYYVNNEFLKDIRNNLKSTKPDNESKDDLLRELM